jgi:glycosyltransferase involved in cell wall biosynthesis
MKIVYVVHDFFPRFYGGTERYVLNIAQQMQRMGHSVTVLNYGLEDPIDSFDANDTDILRKTYVYEGVHVISVRHRSIPAEIGFIIDDQNLEKVIREILKDGAFDVMHIAHPMRLACCYKVPGVSAYRLC